MIIFVFNRQNVVVQKIILVRNVHHVQVFQIEFVTIMVNVKEQVLGKEMVDVSVIRAMKEIIVLNVQMDFMNLTKMKINYFVLIVMLLVMDLAKDQDQKIVKNVQKDGIY